MKNWEKYLESICYPSNISTDRPTRRAEIEKAVNNIPEKYKDRKVLMLGCGDGYEMKILRDRGFTDITGLTYERREFKHAKDNEYSRVVRGDMHDLPFKDNEFDFVYSKETLEHSIAPYIVLCELNRVTKVGGEFIHYIAEGIVKQGEWFHPSCFQPYVWIDLFYLTGFEISKILTAKNRGGQYTIQSAYHGKKKVDKDLMKRIEPYDLVNLVKNIKRDKLDLLCE